MRWLSGVALSCVVACGGAQSPDRADEIGGDGQDDGTRGLVKVEDEGTGQLAVRVRVNAQVGGELRAVAPGDTLRSGDKVELHVEVDRPAYVYVAQFFPDGAAHVHFPEVGDVLVRPGEPVRVPPSGWLMLDDQVGEEHVYIVASTRRLSEVDAAIAGEVDKIRISGKARARGFADAAKGPTKSKQRVKPKPGPKAASKAPTRKRLSLATRGSAEVLTRGTATVIEAEADDGIAVFRHWFVHAK